MATESLIELAPAPAETGLGPSTALIHNDWYPAMRADRRVV